MAQDDHYVSQTYLNAFTNEDGILVPYYKNGHVIIGKPKSTKSVCHEKDGDANSYFNNPRIVDDYLRMFENEWAENVQAFEKMNSSPEAKYGLSGYISFLRTCNPTAKRMGQSLLTDTLEPIADRIMAESTNDSSLDPEIREFYEKNRKNGNLKIEVDIEYAHSKAITKLVDITHKLYCSDWFVLYNNTDTPFITSDNPAVLYYRPETSHIAKTFVPLSPKLGVLIHPNLSSTVPTDEEVGNFKHKNDQSREIKEDFAKTLNELIVKSAENIVLHSESSGWLETLVSNNKSWRMETLTNEMPNGDGTLTMYRQQAVDTKNA